MITFIKAGKYIATLYMITFVKAGKYIATLYMLTDYETISVLILYKTVNHYKSVGWWFLNDG